VLGAGAGRLAAADQNASCSAVRTCPPGGPAPARSPRATRPACEVTQRRDRAGGAAELAVERARYDADRAARSFHAAEPEHRLVVRTLEARWETRLAALAEAEAALEANPKHHPTAARRADLQAMVGDLPRLWHADTTTPRDRKRLLPTLIADITVLPETDRAKVRIGIRWHTGATDKITADRPRPPIGPTVRTPAAAVELIRALGPTTSNSDFVTILNQAGRCTGRGRPFDIDAVHGFATSTTSPPPGPLTPGEVSVAEAADRFGISWAASTTGSRLDTCPPTAAPATGWPSPGTPRPKPPARPVSPAQLSRR
jgi:hypothetical protein